MAGLRAAVAVVPAPEVSVAMTASIGVARSDPGVGRPGTAQPSPGRLLRRAEQARTAAKRRGLNQTRWFDSGEEAAMVRRSRRDLELEQAWGQRQFRLWFQPQVCADSGRLTGFEALLRWQHPTRGLLAPAAFIADLEGSALARPVGWWVLSEALTQLGTWQAAGWDLTVSVNLGAQLVNDAELAAGVAQALARHPQLPPDRLELELLETATIEDVAVVAAQVAQLQAGGVRVALDDFGVGGSSLALLHRLGVDTVKVDRSFVLRLPDDPDLEAMVRTIVALAQRFGADVVADSRQAPVGSSVRRHSWLAVHGEGCFEPSGCDGVRPSRSRSTVGRHR